MPTLAMVCLGASIETDHCAYVWNEKQEDAQETSQEARLVQGRVLVYR